VLEITGGQGVDLVVEAVGHVITQSQTVDMLAAGGEAVLLGLGEASSVPMNGLSMVNRELTVRGSYAYNPPDFSKSLELISNGKIDVASMVVSRSLDSGAELFETLVDRPGDLIKVALIPN
ncbi:MAG: zinc-binding dehydrogenase, partial [Candidatus Latescibacteria bacterium]|nr:zinc-binding dehydrogenase [Candidatus Latescibacterota bacterium]